MAMDGLMIDDISFKLNSSASSNWSIDAAEEV